MVYRVVLADSATHDAYSIYADAAASLRGPQWFEHLIDCLDSLGHFPLRCPFAREAERAGREIRCLLFCKGRNIYRILMKSMNRTHSLGASYPPRCQEGYGVAGDPFTYH